MLAVAVARYLDQLGLVRFDETGVAGDCFIAVLPASPDRVVALFPAGGAAPDPALGYDTAALQIVVRGTQDPRTASERAEAIYGALHGLRSTALPGGVWVVLCRAMQSGPVWVERDANGRHVMSLNFELEVRHVTAHRA